MRRVSTSPAIGPEKIQLCHCTSWVRKVQAPTRSDSDTTDRAELAGCERRLVICKHAVALPVPRGSPPPPRRARRTVKAAQQAGMKQDAPRCSTQSRI